MFICSTFVCPTEIIAFSDRIKDFEALDTAVVGVSVDSHFSHLAWINTPRKVGITSEANIVCSHRETSSGNVPLWNW